MSIIKASELKKKSGDKVQAQVALIEAQINRLLEDPYQDIKRGIIFQVRTGITTEALQEIEHRCQVAGYCYKYISDQRHRDFIKITLK